MKKNDFISELQDILQIEDELRDDTNLASMDEWDSIAFMVLIAFFDKNFGKKITFEDLGACKTPRDLISLAGGDIE